MKYVKQLGKLANFLPCIPIKHATHVHHAKKKPTEMLLRKLMPKGCEIRTPAQITYTYVLHLLQVAQLNFESEHEKYKPSSCNFFSH